MKRVTLCIAISPDCSSTKESLTKAIADDSWSPHSYPLFCPHFFCFFHILFCLIYLFFPSPWPSFLPILCSFSQCVDRKRGLRWVSAHQRGVYCPNLRELALKTKSRASETMEGFTGGRGSKTGPDWVVYLFSVEERGCQQAMWWPGGWGEGWSGLSDWCRAAPIPPIVPYAPHHVFSLTSSMAEIIWLDTVGVGASISASPWLKIKNKKVSAQILS